MPTLRAPCPDCGAEAERSFGEHVHGTRVRTFESWHCSVCGHTTEADDDRLSDPDRAMILATEGAFAVFLEPRQRVALMQVLRASFSMSLAEAVQALSELPGVFRSGLTLAEATAISNAFPSEVARVEVRDLRSG
jgi:ribosomal protein L7/L12